jgi:chromosome segregation ATPase
MGNEGNPEMEALQEELAEARAELERLSGLAADREARVRHLEEQSAALRQDLAQAQETVQAREQELASLRADLEEALGRVSAGAARYRELALRVEPEVPPELVRGESIEEIDAALARARETVARVREQIEAQSLRGRVPPGAPPRSGGDLSGLSPQEKIAHGLRTRGR